MSEVEVLEGIPDHIWNAFCRQAAREIRRLRRDPAFRAAVEEQRRLREERAGR